MHFCNYESSKVLLKIFEFAILPGHCARESWDEVAVNSGGVWMDAGVTVTPVEEEGMEEQ